MELSELQTELPMFIFTIKTNGFLAFLKNRIFPYFRLLGLHLDAFLVLGVPLSHLWDLFDALLGSSWDSLGPPWAPWSLSWDQLGLL